MRRKSSSSNRNAPPGQRQLRVGERLRHLLAEVFREDRFHDPDMPVALNLVTVTVVDIGPDLQHAIAYIMPLGGKFAKETVAVLNKSSGFFRKELSTRIDLRQVPKISFRVDESFEKADHIERLLRQERVQQDILKEDDTPED